MRKFRKLMYRFVAYLLEKQWDTGRHLEGSAYSEWCDHCRATEAATFLRELS